MDWERRASTAVTWGPDQRRGRGVWGQGNGTGGGGEAGQGKGREWKSGRGLSQKRDGDVVLHLAERHNQAATTGYLYHSKSCYSMLLFSPF